MSCKVVLALESVDEILMSDHLNESLWCLFFAIKQRMITFFHQFPFFLVKS